MRRWRDKYVADSARAFGLALIIGGIFREDPPSSRASLVAVGLLVIVSG